MDDALVSILEGELAETITEALEAERVPVAIAVTRTEYGPSPEPGEPGVETTVEYACRGWTESYADDEVNGTLIDQRDVRVMILRRTIAIAPVSTDTVTVDGQTFIAVNVQRDASGTLFIVQGRA